MEEKNNYHKCLCCGKGIVEGNQLYDICSICGWEDDPVQAGNPEFSGGANKMSLDEARKAWKERKQIY
ncbi:MULTISPECIES: CPCC family cysteine-rich protein [Acidaminococcus]|jgi:hypothetical protein|uniref:CPCC family cysteine-rich protein n=1 Tax=Acidaminococcus TaxID=904 RepID=UPI00242A9031|nr:MULTISPECIES: CPCC family cysteine-rich protein [Acidaminococcus]